MKIRVNSHAGPQGELAAEVAALNAEARERWGDPEWMHEMAREISETIYEGFDHENLLGLLANVDTVGWEDRVFVRELRGMRAFWVAAGGYIEASTIRKDVMELPRYRVGFHVFEFEEKLRSNFAETQSDMIDLGIQRLDAEINAYLLRLFQAAIPSSSPYYVTGAGVSLAAVNAALRAVRDASRTREVVILGRSTMVEQIQDALMDSNGIPVGFLTETNEDLVRRGVLGTYRGARIVELLNYLDDQDVPFFPANEMYVMARDASKFAFWGGLEANEWTENEVDYWHYRAHREFGGIIHRPERIRRIVDSSLAP